MARTGDAMKLRALYTTGCFAMVGALLISALFIPFAIDASAASSRLPHQPTWYDFAASIAGEIWSVTTNLLVRFWSQSSIDITKQLSALVAITSIAFNLRALKRAWGAIISAKPLLDFRGRRIGSSKKYQEPMRALLLSFMFYTAYQFLSHVTGLVSAADSPLMMLIDAIIQAALVFLIFWQFRAIRAFATDAFGNDATKQGRFWTLINDALKEHKINLKNLFQSAMLLPLTFVAPRLADVFAGGNTVFPIVSTVAITLRELAESISAAAF
jgi:hypothetical protein